MDNGVPYSSIAVRGAFLRLRQSFRRWNNGVAAGIEIGFIPSVMKHLRIDWIWRTLGLWILEILAL